MDLNLSEICTMLGERIEQYNNSASKKRKLEKGNIKDIVLNTRLYQVFKKIYKKVIIVKMIKINCNILYSI